MTISKKTVLKDKTGNNIKLYLQERGFRGYSHYRIADLLKVFNLAIKTRIQLLVIARNLNIKGYYRFKKERLVRSIYFAQKKKPLPKIPKGKSARRKKKPLSPRPVKIQKGKIVIDIDSDDVIVPQAVAPPVKTFEDVYNVYKTKRYDKEDIFYQKEIKSVENITIEGLYNDIDFVLIDDNDKIILERLKKWLYVDNNNFITAKIQPFYAIEQYDLVTEADGNIRKDQLPVKIRYAMNKKVGHAGNTFDFDQNVDIEDIFENISITVKDYDIRTIFLGYRLIVVTPTFGLTPQNINTLKAFKPSTNRKFHELTCASTPLDNKCIYTTFLEIIGKIKLKYSQRNTKKYRDMITEMLKKEGPEIEKSVKNGELVKSVELLTKKYDVEMLIIFYGSLVSPEALNNKMTIHINRRKTKRSRKIIDKFLGRKVFLYEKHVHVAPSILKWPNKIDSNKKREKIKNKFCLRPRNIKTMNNKNRDLLGFGWLNHSVS